MTAPRALPAQEVPVAEQLFREGRRLMAAGRTEEACKAFDGSFRKDPAVSTLLNLADCREKNGQYATAWGAFLEAARTAHERPDAEALRATALERARLIEPRLSYLIINVTSEASVEGLVILRNGVPVDEAEWNTDIPVDGGDYTIEAKPPGYEPWRATVSVKPEHDKQSVNVPRFHRVPAAASPVELSRTESQPLPLPSRRAAVLTMAGGGVLLLGGLGVGYFAARDWATAEDTCGTDHFCDTIAERARGDEYVERARTKALASTVTVGLGFAAIGVGGVLWFRGARTSGETRNSARIEPVLGRERALLVVTESF